MLLHNKKERREVISEFLYSIGFIEGGGFDLQKIKKICPASQSKGTEED